MPHQSLPNYLLRARLQSGLSQSEVASLVGGTSSSRVSRHETGALTPDVRSVLGYCYLFGESSRELFAGEFHEVEFFVSSRATELLGALLEARSTGLAAQKVAFLEALLASDSTRTQSNAQRHSPNHGH